ncbi:glutamate racemase [Anaerosacchariphilus polymeriproducens]|nr:glutamate racemase [Anaerosacchariphilus polymeriproducens]
MAKKEMDMDGYRCNAPIGVFDSGVGGLTVAREIMRQIPQERVVYFGDTARVPYGSKSKDTIIKYARQIIRFLQTKEVKAIVVACNTASAYALEEIRQEIDLPMIGVVKPGAKVAADTTKNGNVGVIGTEATINSQIYSKFLKNHNPKVKVIGKACPLFVPLVEEGLLKDPVTDEIAARYLKDLKRSEIDTLIMGCTHYPLLRSTIRKIMGEDVTLVNPAYETAVELKRMLEKENIKNEEDDNQPEERYQFYVSDTADKFKNFANSILPYDIETIKQINIEEY